MGEKFCLPLIRLMNIHMKKFESTLILMRNVTSFLGYKLIIFRRHIGNRYFQNVFLIFVSQKRMLLTLIYDHDRVGLFTNVGVSKNAEHFHHKLNKKPITFVKI